MLIRECANMERIKCECENCKDGANVCIKCKCENIKTGLTNLPDLTSLAAFGQLRNAIKYCTEARKSDAADGRVERFNF